MRLVTIATTSVLLGSAAAIWVAQNSPCGVSCGNVLTDTTPADMSCAESNYGYSTTGTVFQSCIDCELTSNYTYNNQSDLQWLLYNVRYAFSYCLFGDPGNSNVGDTPCITSTACGPLKAAFEWQNFTTSGGPYDYCAVWTEVQVPKCSYCLTAGGDSYLNNYLTILDAACAQRPEGGDVLSVQGTPFTTVPMNITTPTPTPLYSYHRITGPLSLGAEVGIAVGAVVFILAVAGCCIVCNGRRRRRAFLRQLEQRHQQDGWPHPSERYGKGSGGGPEMFETPVSQKPLTGWEDSPVSAATEKAFPRYFSPYSSQFNSPVSATDALQTQQWPTLAEQNAAATAAAVVQPRQQTPQKEQMLQRELQQQEALHTAVPGGVPPIGLALGGDEASLRSKGSLPQMQDAKGKERDVDEVYEMHEVDSAHSGSGSSGPGRHPRDMSAPVLQQPMVPAGRNSPPRRQLVGRNTSAARAGWYGDLTDDDVRSGRAL